MSVRFRIISSAKFAHFKVSGNITTIEEILCKGTSLFTDEDWENGFNVLLDYRDVSQMDIYGSDVRQLVFQDKKNSHLFDKSRFAVVAVKDFVYGLARMWEILSEHTRIECRVLRNIDKALDWLGYSPEILYSVDFYS